MNEDLVKLGIPHSEYKNIKLKAKLCEFYEAKLEAGSSKKVKKSPGKVIGNKAVKKSPGKVIGNKAVKKSPGKVIVKSVKKSPSKVIGNSKAKPSKKVDTKPSKKLEPKTSKRVEHKPSKKVDTKSSKKVETKIRKLEPALYVNKHDYETKYWEFGNIFHFSDEDS